MDKAGNNIKLVARGARCAAGAQRSRGQRFRVENARQSVWCGRLCSRPGGHPVCAWLSFAAAALAWPTRPLPRLALHPAGVRNTVGFDFHPDTKKLYFTDNGRDSEWGPFQASGWLGSAGEAQQAALPALLHGLC